jgi:hypothetical protein
VEEEKVVHDNRSAWSGDHPFTSQENEFIERQGFGKYGDWHLAINYEEPEETKKRYEFPYGDFKKVHRCGVLAAESRAGQYKHADIEEAAAQLLAMIDQAKPKAAGA